MLLSDKWMFAEEHLSLLVAICSYNTGVWMHMFRWNTIFYRTNAIPEENRVHRGWWLGGVSFIKVTPKSWHYGGTFMTIKDFKNVNIYFESTAHLVIHF